MSSRRIAPRVLALTPEEAAELVYALDQATQALRATLPLLDYDGPMRQTRNRVVAPAMERAEAALRVTT